jgi:hypothetical protein
MLSYLNSRGFGHFVLRDLEDYLNKFEIPGVRMEDFILYGNGIAGKTFYSELLLLGFHCPGIKDWECALDGDDGYWWYEGGIMYVSRQHNEYDPYEIREFLHKRESGVKKKYKEYVKAL